MTEERDVPRVTELLMALLITAALFAAMTVAGGWEQEALEEHGEFMGRQAERGAAVL